MRGRWVERVVGVVVTGVCLLGGVSCGTSEPKPSIVFILIDTLRHDYLGCTGFDGPVSPHIDALAKESHVFPRAYAQSSWTKPSVASMMTGLFPSGHGLKDHEGMFSGEAQAKGVLPESAETLAEMLAGRGYTTAAVVSNPWITKDYGFDQGFEFYDDSAVGTATPADSVLSRARAWLANRDNDPFFLYLHFMDVHGPYAAPDSYFRRLEGRSTTVVSDTVLTRLAMIDIPQYLRTAKWVGTKSAYRVETWRTRYAAGVKYLDEQLGKFLDELRAQGVLDEAMVVITSDHGEELYDHQGWDHGLNLHEHQIRVPLVIRPPGGLAQGERHDDVVSLVDLPPTLLRFAGETDVEGFDGEDLGPLLDGTGEPGGVSFATYTKLGRWASVCVGRYKIIRHMETGDERVFDVVEDPGETRDLTAERPKLAVELSRFMAQVLATQRGRSMFEAGPPISEERRQQFRSLGYMN